jgi:bifunctional non-homologous end joining protein LigD
MSKSMPKTIEPMKARLEDPGPGTDWQFEIKWDGYRAIAFSDDKGFRLQGRRLNEIGPDFPELSALGEHPQARGTILDGEIVVLDEQGRPDFQLMQSRREQGLSASFMIFDLLWAEGRDLRRTPYLERREMLEAMEIEEDRWSVPARIEASLEEAMAATEQLGLEGIIAKDPGSPYVEGKRSRYWLKVKHQRRQEFVIGGWLPGKGHRESTLGALLVGYQDVEGSGLRFAGRVGTGMDDRLLGELSRELLATRTDTPPFVPRDLPDIPSQASWCEPLRVVEVRFTQWTRDGRLRNPVFLGFRPDKTPQEVIREES